MIPTPTQKLPVIPIMKFILILGVILIHCNIKYIVPSDCGNKGLDVVNFINSLMDICVPSFFIISGYLFFYGVDSFTSKLYKKKLSNRFKTLFIPYIIWNVICAILFIIKVLVFNSPGIGIIENDTINWSKFFEGFVYREEVDDQPYAFAFWFIRNLIVFVILSPMVWFIARKWWTVILLLSIKFIFDIKLHCIEWFIFGAACSIHRVMIDKIKPVTSIMYLSGILYLLLAIFRFWLIYSTLIDNLLLFIEVVSGCCFLYLLSEKLVVFSNTYIGRQLVSSTFFIYAFHQCFCFALRKLWLHIIGYNSILNSLLTYIVTFISIFSISFVTYLLLNRYFPKVVKIISGNRS